jgi:hypothetical protein
MSNNIMSFNQLADWNNDAHDDLLNDYYDCLIECEDDHSSCKRICKEILV